MKIPRHLKHKPVFVMENYDSIDGPYAPDTDAMGLSLGLAQWNAKGNVEISAKIWRYNERWSRQSEEMPLHRVLDLAVLICKATQYLRNTGKREKPYDPGNPVAGSVELQDERLEVAVDMENPEIDEDFSLFSACLAENKEWLDERFQLLAAALQELGDH